MQMLRSIGWVAPRAVLAAFTAGVCFAQTPPDPSDHAATVIALTGQVSVLRDSQPWALNTGDRIRPRQVVVTGEDGYAQFKLADGSTFDVFPNSQVVFRDNPGNWSDLLEIMLGRIKVHIQKWGGQPNRNRIRTPTAVISVRGTVFDVVVEDEEATLVSVEEGQVAVDHVFFPRREPRLLNPGEWLRVYRDQPLARQQIDRGSVIRAALRAMSDAMIEIVYRNPRGPGGAPIPGGGSSGGGAPLPGDHDTNKPPPAPPGTGQSPPPPSGDPGPGAPPPPPPK
jgi:hypothetical protein